MLIARLGNVGLDLVSADIRAEKRSIKFRNLNSTVSISEKARYCGMKDYKDSIKRALMRKTIRMIAKEKYSDAKFSRARQYLRYRIGLSKAVENLWYDYF